MLERRGVVAAPLLDEAADERHGVNDDRQRRPGQGNRVAQPPNSIRQRRRQTRVALAGERRIDLAAEEAPLREERSQREQEQEDAQRRGATLRTDHPR